MNPELDVSIAPVWTIRRADGRVLNPRVVDLLVHVDGHGSLAAACDAIGASYRHAWQLLREGEALFGQPLLVMARGRGSQLTPLGQRLVWAHRRIQARLSPMLDSLASELQAEVQRMVAVPGERLRLHASHGFAVQTLHALALKAGPAHDLKYCGTVEALESLRSGACDVAGFHVPTGTFEAPMLAHYRPWLDLKQHRVIRLAVRRQGLMVAPGNPRKVYDVADLARPDVRFINRQQGSGTRVLLDLMLAARGITASSVRGYEQCEYTHAAVAAYVASGMADVGFGVEVPAREFDLDFLPMQQEQYLLLCDARSLDAAPVQQLVAILGGSAYREQVDRLPGYAVADSGTVATLTEAFPSLAEQVTVPATKPPQARRPRGAAR